MKNNILIIIPASGGSKGIPKKNIRPLNGKPLIWYSINNGLNLEYNCDVYVSSDDTEILSISKSFGGGLISLECSETSIAATHLVKNSRFSNEIVFPK